MDKVGLEVAMLRKGVTNTQVADMLKISNMALYNKKNGVSEFKESEIRKIVEYLDLSSEEINDIFFIKKVN